MVDVPTISIAIASASVVAGVIYYAFQVRHQTRTRQTDLVMRLYATFSSTEFQDAWAKVRNKASNFETIDDIYDFDTKVGFRQVNQVCLFFEGIGILLQRKLLDTRMVEDLFGGAVARAWEKVKTGVIKARKQLNDPTIYYYFEYLYNEMQKKNTTTTR
ncbi:MAG TPA: DUF4760 domain-containing protein [Candidatus Krumholzibacteriaceae bacterium]|jgi:hypothetical protein|nr:DUF4760 domain-containing protein [Candidatus Krumholzibacteriaceae bacterium]